jgi:serine/threonine protein kinase
MTSLTGKQFGNYRLIRLLGQGGSAEVYQGEHVHLGSYAAIKIISGKFSAKDEEDFKNEAQMLAKLTHPNIVRLLEFGIEQGTPFLVMTFAENGSLRDLHPEGTQVPLATIVSYVKQVASGLQTAHDKKIIHRDIKPENMLIGPNGDIWLTDFGIAIASHSTRSRTMQNIAGTVEYTAPEQFQKKAVLASDQYALGIVVYEWISGLPPFQGTLQEIIHQHFSDTPPSLRTNNPAIPTAVEQVVFTSLAKDPQKRFPSVQAFAQALEQACTPKVTVKVAPPSNTSPSSPAPAVQVALLPRQRRRSPNIQPQNAQQQMVQPQQIQPQNVQQQIVQPQKVQPQPNNPDWLYSEGMKAHAAGDLERAASLWQQYLDLPDPPAPNNYYSPPASQTSGALKKDAVRLLLENLGPQRIEHMVALARKAEVAGDWQREIDLWEQVIYVLHNQADYMYQHSAERHAIQNKAYGRKSIAKQNLENQPLYEHAQYLLTSGNKKAARETLQTLWNHAPQYGDPASLAKKAGISSQNEIPVPVTYYLTLLLRYSSLIIAIVLLLIMLSFIIANRLSPTMSIVLGFLAPLFGLLYYFTKPKKPNKSNRPRRF